MLRKTGVAAALIVAVVGVAAAFSSSNDAPTERSLVVGSASYLWGGSPRDWVGWADQIAVVRVVSEQQLPMDSATTETGEGLVGRRVVAAIEETIWARDDTVWARAGAGRATGSVSLKTTDGWWAKNGLLIPYKDVGSHRAEVGDRLLVAIFKSDSNGWTLMADGVPVSDDNVVTADADQVGISASIGGKVLGDLSGTFGKAEPYPEVAKYSGLDPDARMEAVSKEGQAGRQVPSG